jgi:flagellar hook protein FlgE
MKVAGNLPSGAAVADTVTGSITVYDSLGKSRTVTATMTKTADNAWTIKLGTTGTTVALAFNATTGALTTASPQNVIEPADAGPPARDAVTYSVDISGLTQYASPSSFAVTEQNGYGVGALNTFTTTSNGQLIGVYSNGKKQAVAQLAVAVFNNPNALETVGDTMYRDTVNSGVPLIGGATLDGRGSIMGGALEMSNVDLSAEFTNLIVSQRGFAANSRTLTASDEMLQELMNIKR